MGNPESSDFDEDKLSRGDLDYLLKLGAGSVAGAALIKYRSVAFPEITKPNLIEALFLLSAPIVLAVLLLTKLSKRGIVSLGIGLLFINLLGLSIANCI